ncbi:MAG: metallophosphoesterase [Bacilli bacterium]|nr:metallophosphoesterase [Bacilli bacterium]
MIQFIDEINSMNATKVPIYMENGHPRIVYSKREYTVQHLNAPKKKFTIMLESDKHIDHVCDNFEYIHNNHEEAAKRGVDYIFDLGDVFNGPLYRVNNPKKVRTGTLEGAIQRLKQYHPSRIPTHIITGNHDLKYMEYYACDIGRLAEYECKNIIFCDNLFTSIQIGNFRVNFSHGSIENKLLANINLSKEHPFLTANNPHMIAQGHFHISSYPEYSNPFLCQVPSSKVSKQKEKTTVGNKGKETGIVFITVNELSDEFEIEQETIEFGGTKKFVKREIRIKK